MSEVKYVLGLDIGSNSVGSAAWVPATGEIVLGASVFPAGVEQSDRGRGDPVGRDRRTKRTLRRMIARRAERKRQVWMKCIEVGLLPASRAEIDCLLQDEAKNPWRLRAEGLDRELSPCEFGRVLLHMAQRRGGLGLNLPTSDETGTQDPESDAAKDEKASRLAFDHTRREMQARNARTYGELVWKMHQEARRTTASGVEYFEPVRNRDNLLVQSPEKALFVKREMIRAEFAALWDKQQSFNGPLAKILTDKLRKAFDDPSENENWRHQGILFGQRRTKWDLGVLGRCTLEPTDRCVPLADMHAQHFRVIETVNNLRIRTQGHERSLTADERAKVIALLKAPLLHETGKHKGKPKKSAGATDIKRALGLPLRDKSVRLNFEDRDSDREINTDWFSRSFIHGVFGPDRWATMTAAQRESVNRAVLKFDPESEDHEVRLRAGCAEWWQLSPQQTEAFISAWRDRPKPEKRLKRSRRALLNLLPYLDVPTADGAWPTEIQARKAFAEDAEAVDSTTAAPATPAQRNRYFLGVRGLTHKDRHFLKKHPGLLPPAPMMTNPVVRKAIHEVRRHIVAYIRRFGCKPERIVLEFTRDATQSGKMRDEILNRNRWRDKIRKQIGEDVVVPAWGRDFHTLSTNARRLAVDRVLLARQQGGICPYCGNQPAKPALSDRAAALGEGCEIDHIQPYSATGDNSLNNRVLCHTECNRAKKKRSPRQWWADRFDQNVLYARKCFDEHEWTKGDYFTKRDYERKWANFCRETPIDGAFSPGQMEATAYAAKAVKAYLADALYEGRGSSEHGGERTIFVTHGKYTAMLRRDWQLFQTLRDDGAEGEAAQAAGQKNRADHRHHAVDAVVIALTTPEILPALGQAAKAAEEYFAVHGRHTRRDPIPPPREFNMDVGEFRRHVLSKIFATFDKAARTGAKTDGQETGSPLIVSHRPVKRKLIGSLHKDTQYGPVLLADGARDPSKVTVRYPISRLKAAHLRVPEGWDDFIAKSQDPSIHPAQRALARRAIASLPDPAPEIVGLVRDRELRGCLRRRVREFGLDPDRFTDKDIQTLLKQGKALTLDSGKPVRAFVLLRSNSDPVAIPRSSWNPAAARRTAMEDARSVRLYDSQNNHHVEIRENANGRWSGDVVKQFEAARRVRALGRTAVDRSDDPGRGGKFIMSLCEGETVYMRHPSRGYTDYFVVFKIDASIHFIHHWDARGASERKDPDGKPVPGSAREDVAVTVGNLKRLGPLGDGAPPYKVRVSPLGEPVRLEKD